MALSNTERSRRFRRHRQGDHSLCDNPERCAELGTPAPADESRGERLYRELSAGLGPETLVLLDEAARMTDRLDKMEDILTGNRHEWMRFRTEEDGDIVVKITGVVTEARQHATALKAIMQEIRAAKAAAEKDKPDDGEEGVAGLFDDDELAPRRAHRGN